MHYPSPTFSALSFIIWGAEKNKGRIILIVPLYGKSHKDWRISRASLGYDVALGLHFRAYFRNCSDLYWEIPRVSPGTDVTFHQNSTLSRQWLTNLSATLSGIQDPLGDLTKGPGFELVPHHQFLRQETNKSWAWILNKWKPSFHSFSPLLSEQFHILSSKKWAISNKLSKANHLFAETSLEKGLCENAWVGPLY